MHKQIFETHLKSGMLLAKKHLKSDDEVQGIVAQYLCVMLNGRFENYFQACLKQIYRKDCGPKSFSLIEQQIDGIYNLKKDRIEKMIARFNSANKSKIKNYFANDDKLKEAIGTIVQNKNNLGHTGFSSISLIRVIEALQHLEHSLHDFHAAAFD